MCAPFEATGLKNQDTWFLHQTCVHICIHVQVHGCACFHVTASCITYRWRSSVHVIVGILTAAPGKGRVCGSGLRTLLGCSDLTRPQAREPLFPRESPHTWCHASASSALTASL